MRRFVVLSLLFVLLPAMAAATSIDQKTRLTEADFSALLGGRMVSLGMVGMASDEGTLFVMARDKKTRKLSWHVVDPFARRVLAQGTCPFTVVTEVAFSADGQRAAVFTRYPNAMWYLRVADGNWHRGFESSKPGLGIVSFSPLSFVNETTAATILDEMDPTGLVKDSFIVRLPLSPFSIQRFVSLKALRQAALSAVYPAGPPASRLFQTDFVRYGSDPSIVFVLKSKDRSAVGTKGTKPSLDLFSDYLLRYAPGQPALVLERGEKTRLFPLDYVPLPMAVLYSRHTATTHEVVLLSGGRKQTLLPGNAVAGRLMDNGLVGVVTMQGQSLAIHVGTAADGLKKVYTTTSAYSCGFARTGKRLLLLSPSEVLCYNIRK